MIKVIFGVGHLSEMLYSYIADEECGEIACFTVGRNYMPQSDCSSLPRPICALEDLPKLFDCAPEEIFVTVGVGYNAMNDIRKAVFHQIKNLGYQIEGFVHRSAVVASSSKMGKGCILMENAILQPYAEIGDGNILWSGAIVSHHARLGDYNFLAPSASIAGEARIGDRCFIGNNSTIRNGIVIGNEVMIGAGCYVSKDIEDGSVLMGPRPYYSDKKSSQYFTW